MKQFFILLLIFSFSGCSHSPKKNEFALRNQNLARTPSLFQEYILGATPQWLNFSYDGKCQRHEQTTYLNYKKLMQSFSFDYGDALEVQRQYFDLLQSKRKTNPLETILMKDRSELLSTVIERVKAQRFSLNLSEYNRINLIWIDPILKREKLREHLFSLSMFETGFPVLISFCFDHHYIEKLIQDSGTGEFSGEIIGQESFSIYDDVGKTRPFFFIDFNKLLGDDKDLYIYLPKHSVLPHGFIGSFKEILYY